jgi:type II secretory pathway component GspD/PulD (secretin)
LKPILLLLLLLLLLPFNSRAAQAQQPTVAGQSQAYTPQLGRPQQPTELNIPGAAQPPDPLADAARAIINAAGLSGQGTSGAAATQSQPKANPFATAVNAKSGNASARSQQPAPLLPQPAQNGQQNLLVPATQVDPEKVVVNESDGLISLMVREGSLRQVVAMIADTQKLNIVFAGPNDVNVTASFDRQPWQTVLNSLLSASGHAWAMHEGVIFISSLEQANFLPPGAQGRRVAVFELDFASAVDVDQTVKGLLSPAGESWLVETSKTDNRRTREAIAVVDYPASLQRISDYICQADQPPRQVFIEAHILQVNLDDECRSGVNFQELMSLSSGNVRLSAAGLASAQPVRDFPTNSPTSASPAFFVEANGSGLDALIELVKTTTDSKTLAKPNIHAVSGQESHIQIGGQLGYRITTTTQTSTMESVQFLDVGVVLRVTPRITRDGRVLMRIYPKVSTGAVDPETGLPSEETTEVETDVLVTSGQGIVIGGLIQETDDISVSKLPLLGEIPYLGILFQRRTSNKVRQEIIVTLKPHVLPYSPIVHEHLATQYARSVGPLTQGAIESVPRPLEPRIPDVFKHVEEKQGKPLEQHKHHKYGYPNPGYYEGAELMDLPAIDETFEMIEPTPYNGWDGFNPEEIPAPAPSNPFTAPAHKAKQLQ